MKTPILTAFLGLATGLAFAFSCSGDDASGADAQTACNCDPAEPPLAGRIQQFDSEPTLVTAGGVIASKNASCPGGTVIGGGCLQVFGDISGTELIAKWNGPVADGWSCGWKNDGTVDAMATAHVICLMPPASN